MVSLKQDIMSILRRVKRYFWNDNEFKEVNLLLESLFPSEKPEPGPYEIRNPLVFLNYFRNDNFGWELVTTTTTTLLQ